MEKLDKRDRANRRDEKKASTAREEKLERNHRPKEKKKKGACIRRGIICPNIREIKGIGSQNLEREQNQRELTREGNRVERRTPLA